MEFNLKNILYNKGFSLIELSVVMTVIGVTVSGALSLATKKLESEKIDETENKLELIEQALRIFLVDNQRIPCPADGELPIDNAAFGVETTPQISLLLPTCNGANFQTADNIINGGVVPVKTLNLEDDIMFDGWGRRFTYVVDAHFTMSGIPDGNNGSCNNVTSDVCFQYKNLGSIIIRDDVAAPGSLDFIADDAIYTIISHGKNGNGAFNYFGSSTRISASAEPKEQENAEPSTAPHGLFDNTFIDNAVNDTFDDFVRYRTKSQMVIDTYLQNGDNSDIDQGSSACSSAMEEVQGVSNICAGANDNANCVALVTRFHRMCLEDFL